MPQTKIKIELDTTEIAVAIDAGGLDGLRLAGDFVATEARVRAPQRTGQLANSIQAQPPMGRLSDNSASVTIGAGAPYASFVEFGTGIHGPTGEAFWVEPRDRRALRFSIPGGGFVFSMGHFVDGMKPQPFLGPAVDQNHEPIGDILASAISNALDRIGT